MSLLKVSVCGLLKFLDREVGNRGVEVGSRAQEPHRLGQSDNLMERPGSPGKRIYPESCLMVFSTTFMS